MTTKRTPTEKTTTPRPKIDSPVALVTGSSGLIGRALSAALVEAGWDVVSFLRDKSPAEQFDRLERLDAVFNLAGANIAGGRWTAARKAEILDSRVNVTRGVADQIQKRPVPLINASAIGAHGDGFLSEVTKAWEAEASRAGSRVVLARFGVVLAQEGGALAKMLPIFRWGLGGRLGDGTQRMSWVTLQDAVRALLFLLETPTAAGPFDIVAPGCVTNAEFTRALAARLHRPAVFPVPAFILKGLFGQMAEETLLGDFEVFPTRLRELGFTFTAPRIPEAFASLLP